MKRGPGLISDFWWLPKNVYIENLLIGVGHHKEIANNEDVPPLESWYRSFDQEGKLSNDTRHYPISSINKWRSACKNTNVYRTLKVFDQSTREAVLLGPFLVDIDNSGENLDDAQAVTKQLAVYMIKQLKLFSDNLHIFFSGHKGFNMEVCPEALEIGGSVPDQIRLSSSKLDEIITFLRSENNIQDSTKNVVSSQGTVIDRIYGDRFNGYKLKHPYIRLHDSINKWIRDGGNKIARRKMERTLEQLWDMSAALISVESEKLALIP